MKLATLRPKVSTLDTRSAKPPPKTVDKFYLSSGWRTLIARLIRQRGRGCEKCPRTDCRIFGDHIVELKDGGAPLDPANVMLLCGSCHTSKTVAVRAERMAGRF